MAFLRPPQECMVISRELPGRAFMKSRTRVRDAARAPEGGRRLKLPAVTVQNLTANFTTEGAERPLEKSRPRRGLGNL